jgi:hypothetical protein
MKHDDGPAVAAFGVQIDHRSVLIREEHVGESVSDLRADSVEVD